MPSMALNKTLIVIVGPTGIGKTALAIALAKHFSTEIISADSRQFFKEMEIGTAKPSTEELAAAPHHFINSHSIKNLFSTGDFEVQAMELITKLFEKHKLLIMVGGSGLYIDAVCNGLDDLPQTDMNIREQLNQRLENEGLEAIKKQLSGYDPEYYNKVDQANPQRMIRGLEFYLSTGTKLSAHLTNRKKTRPFNIIKIGMNMDRTELYNRINQRVDKMMEAGLLDEVKGLQPFRKYNALNTVGYSELFAYLDGEITLKEAVDQIKQNTRRFAKRQLTWFRRDDSTTWFEPGQDNAVINYISQKTG
ncbi:MAG: tRNA (adenosine(37)-N6)-dimethylallyltransferase MiaA [Candidatus Pedobacter colombiensis]|uniref:tRNA dimethylallyltransferase n=1 Tax=Candidatus Pedobacter colombiensis TaxID=3121371 RepID=A0AAJ6B7P9_9SPHI|nr:tRNA (adenosine(37)-N6)-dimethylallyltransferase MiaA [Pedobacter sp.]WEK20089.1 MAG: tRNA (adenosine(37)-N6)-dimethylallyltransferase MiaA [Pedobacter sp.]